MLEAAVVAAAALAVTLAAWPWAVPLLARLRFRQAVRQAGPPRHLGKAGTPTMGGLVFVPAAALSAWVAGPRDVALAVGLVVVLGHAAIGFADDYRKAVWGRSLGLRAREKLAVQVLLGLALGLLARDVLGLGTWVAIPFTVWRLDLGSWYVALVVLVVLAAANAANLTDGLDGLLAGSAAISFAAFAAIAWAQGEGAAMTLAAALCGACLGFLRVNWHPARAFMGDTGSMAIGAGLGALAVLVKAELWLLVLGGLYVLETLSVIVQVAAFRLFGRRVLRMSPLHHHLELGGMPERAVVVRMWILSAGFGAAAVLGYLTGPRGF